MDISLSPELAKFIDEKVRSGRYKDAREVLDDGLRLLKLRDDTLRSWREQIEQGWAEAQAGDLVDGPKAIAAIRNSLADVPASVAADVDVALREAIGGLRVIEIVSEGQARIGEPHDYGIMNGQAMLLFYQTAGYSRSGGLPMWRHLRVARISTVRILQDTFVGNRASQNHRKWDKLFLRA
jgi:antitoxin ParD1/3/4